MYQLIAGERPKDLWALKTPPDLLAATVDYEFDDAPFVPPMDSPSAVGDDPSPFFIDRCPMRDEEAQAD